MLGQARGWLSLALLLGATWALGLLGKAAVAAVGDEDGDGHDWGVAVAFVVLNSAQGLLIFVFHVVLSQRYIILP